MGKNSVKQPSKEVAVSSETHDDVSTGNVEVVDHALKRSLRPRHLQMIAIGGVIGTGLFLGTATSLQNGGPAGFLLSYIIMGSLLFAVMVGLGEMISEFPMAGGHMALGDRFVDPALGFAMGWLFWYIYIVVLPAELSAAAVLTSYWTPAGEVGSTCTAGICNNSLWIAIMLLVVWGINYAGTRVYGEMEFWFCSLKVITIVGLIILGIILSAGGGPSHEVIGFKYWAETGGFMQLEGIPGAKGRFLGFFSTLINAAFAFVGTEMTSIGAAETSNPRKAVPNAIRGVWIRLLLFYICSAFVIGILVSPSDPSLNLSSTAAKSPFVIAINHAGIPVLPSIINAVLLSSAWSAAVADLFVSSRTLYGLYSRGLAPSFVGKVRSDGLPWVCVLIGSVFALLSFMAGAGGQAGTVFGYFSNMTAIGGVLSWTCILYTSIRFQKGLRVQGIDRNKLAYKAPFQPYLNGFAMCLIIVIFGGFTSFLGSFDASSFVTTYFTLLMFAMLFFGYKFYHKTKAVDYKDMDFKSGSSADLPSEPSKGLWAQVKDYI